MPYLFYNGKMKCSRASMKFNTVLISFAVLAICFHYLAIVSSSSTTSSVPSSGAGLDVGASKTPERRNVENLIENRTALVWL
mmetsp:Transcript_33860/g.37792  ORF Transcript_33860/g.37792 Transcript_33860/m.37792 type:complete len:82 (+) Transcript_33860:74-319(+)